MTLTTTDYREVKAQAEAEDAAEQARRDQAAAAAIQRRQAAEVAEREAYERAVPEKYEALDAAEILALDGAIPALNNIIETARAREDHIAQDRARVAVIVPEGERIGRVSNMKPWPTVGGYSLRSHKANVAVELAARLAPIFRALGDKVTAQALDDAVRSGNRIPAKSK